MLSRIFKSKWLWLILLIGCTCCLFPALLCATSPAGLGVWQFVTGDRWTRESLHPFPNGLPAQEIVFSPADPAIANTQFPTLGFIYADGTGREEYSLTLYEGSRSMWGVRIKTSQGMYPRWSRDGKLVFSIRGVPPTVRVIDQQGRMYGGQCNTLNHGRLTFDLQGNVLAPIYERSEVYQHYQGYTVPSSVLIARHDLKHCRINGIFLLPISADPKFVDAIGENPEGWLIASFYDFDAGTYKILLYHPVKKVQRIFLGRHPAFSDDGEWLAYYRPDDYLVVRRVGIEEEYPLTKVFNRHYKWPTAEEWGDELSLPGWSPDSAWLVYNDGYGRMYKINRESGEKVYLGEGWAPDWR